VNRREFTAGLLLAATARTVRAEERAKKHRIAIITTQPVANIDNPTIPVFQAFFEELRRLGEVEGQNLTIERYSGGGRPAVYPDLAREVVARSPDVIVAIGNPITHALRAATGTIPIVWIGVDPIEFGFATSLARPGGNLTGVSLYDVEFYAKRLQILKEAAPSASKVAYLTMRRTWEAARQAYQPAYQQASQRLQISLMPMLLQEATPPEIEHVFAEIAPNPPDAIMVADIGELIPYRQLIVGLVEKNRLPAMYACVSSSRRVGCWPMRPISAKPLGAWPTTSTRSSTAPNPATSRSTNRPDLHSLSI